MSFPATEIAIIPLSSGASIEDPLSPLGEIWQSCLGTIAGQKGFRRLYWGRRVESSNVIDFFVGKLLRVPLQPLEAMLIRCILQTGIPFKPIRNLSRIQFTSPFQSLSPSLSKATHSSTIYFSPQTLLPRP